MTIEQKDLKEMVESFKAATDEVKGLKEKHAAEIKQLGEANAETKAALDAAQAKFDEQFKAVDDIVKELQAKAKRPGFGAMESKTLGQHFVESEVFAEMKASERATGKPLEVKDITGAAGSAIALVNPDRDPTVYRTIGGYRATRIRDLLPVVPTSSGSVEIMRLTTFDDQSGPQQAVEAPSSAAGGGEFQAKKKSNLVWTLVTVPVRTIAHWVAASRQVLSDAPMLRGLIDTELTYGLSLESDEQLLFGNGTGQNLTGIMNDNAINDVGELPSGTTNATLAAAMIDHIRGAVTRCQQSEYYNINGIVLNPADWQVLETAKATDGHYLLVAFAATSAETPTIWRVPVVVTNAMEEGEFLLGDWTMGATIYAREGVSVRVSESHANFFVENGVAVLAEERYCLAVNRPKAFCKGSFDIAAASS
jgi:HK97 family phage major capsid protein